MQYLCNRKIARELSSVGLERLPYKQRVGGSTPSAPTKNEVDFTVSLVFIYICAFTASVTIPSDTTVLSNAILEY